MNLRELIRKEHSTANCDRIVQWIGNDQRRFDELIRLFLDDEPMIRQRAGWPLSYSAMAHPSLIRKHIGRLLRNLQQPGLHDAVKRNTVRLLQDMEIPERYRGLLMNTCFNFISSPTEKPAVKVFSMTILHNLSKQYPDIRQELQTLLKDQWDQESAAFRARARKILKELS